jgi:mono/diheme cytochrome c family protein
MKLDHEEGVSGCQAIESELVNKSATSLITWLWSVRCVTLSYHLKLLFSPHPLGSAGGSMKLLRSQSLGFLLFLLVVGLMLAGCAPDANARLISPELGAQLYAAEANEEVVVEPTAVPLRFADLTPEQVTAGLPEDFAAALANADPGRGETVALANGCGGCHNVDPAIVMTGPTWHNMADTAASRQPDQGPATYIYTSIVQPNAYVVPDYPSGVMPQNYEDVIPTEDLANLVAYLLTQHE